MRFGVQKAVHLPQLRAGQDHDRDEFAVDDDPDLFVLACDRLISCCEIDDAEPRVPKTNAAVWRYPMALPIRTAMIEALGGPLQRYFRDRLAAREQGYYSAHSDAPWS